MKALTRRLLLIVLAAVALAAPALSQGTEPDLSTVMERVRERVKHSYIDQQKLAWTDTARQEFLKEDGAPKEKPQESVYEMIIRLQPAIPGDDGPPFYIRAQRDLKLVDGKPVKKKESTSDNSENMGVLLFLLVSGKKAEGYTFSYAGQADFEGRKALTVDISYAQKTEPRVTWDDRFVLFGVRYEFQLSGVIFTKGRIWIDANTYNVLRLDWRSNPFEFEHPHGHDKLTYEQELTARFKPMTFESPSETIIVPESIEVTRTIRGGARVPIHRSIRSFGNYKRFTGDIKITPHAP